MAEKNEEKQESRVKHCIFSIHCKCNKCNSCQPKSFYDKRKDTVEVWNEEEEEHYV